MFSVVLEESDYWNSEFNGGKVIFLQSVILVEIASINDQ